MKQDELFQAIDEEDDIDRAKVLVELYKARAQEESTKFKAWSRSFIVTVSVAALTGIIGIISSFLQHQSQINLEDRKAAHQLIRNAIQGDPDVSRANIQFLLASGLIDDRVYQNDRISQAAKDHSPRRSTEFDVRQPDSELGVNYFSSNSIKRLLEIHAEELPDYPVQIIELPKLEGSVQEYGGFVPVGTDNTRAEEIEADLSARAWFIEENVDPWIRTLDDVCTEREFRLHEQSNIQYIACSTANADDS
ncbi:MAG: hypothetical protein AAFR45_07850 [Pseudomonadota bacterium]